MTTSAWTGAQLIYYAQRQERGKSFCCPKYRHTSLSTQLNMAIGRYTRHALHCRRSLPILLPAFRQRSRLTEQCSSRSIWQLHSTMWTINNCSIVSSTPTYRQQSVAGLTTICRKHETKFIFGKKNIKQKGENINDTRRSTVSSALQLLSGRLSTTTSEHQADQVCRCHCHLHIRTSGGWPNQWPQHISVASAQLHQQKKLTVPTGNYTVTFFTPDTHENHLHPQVKLADQVLPLEKRPKVLGVTLDTHLTFTQHCNNVSVKVQQRNNVLRALAGSTWGCDLETLLTTYQAIGRSILSYCCPVWTPSLKDTNWSRLQRAQSSALRIATGCLKMTDVVELHQEARELPVRQHNQLISQQFAIACHLPQHPCYQLCHRHPCYQLCHRPPDDQSERRRSLIGRFRPNIQQYLAEESPATPATSR